MSIFSENVEALAALLKAIAWPSLAAYAVWKVAPSLPIILDNRRSVAIRGFGVEATISKIQDALSTAAIVKTEDAATAPSAVAEVAKVAFSTVQSLVTGAVAAKARNSAILWVDDNPHNNELERTAIEALGFTVQAAISTDEAVQALRQTHFVLVISDMQRPESDHAGFQLLEKIRSSGNRVPVVFYRASDSVDLRVEARKAGAFGSTNSPVELFRLVISAISN
ncbi:response regulator [Aureimonas sp. N4]|uniref:response regulator n=1 Tax=Aureimonas sp. N4 TaxID=1638165 RepID=UPI00178CC016|nr:response regulator [Aureimonas sp. N4]